MNNLVTLRIEGKDVKRFVFRLSKQKIGFYFIEYHPHSAIVTVSYEDYCKIKEMKTIYEIHLLRLKGFVHLKEILYRYRIFLLALFTGIFLLVFLSHVIFSVEIVHNKKEVREFLQEELEKRGIRKLSFVKSFAEKDAILQDIVREYRDYVEWVELERVGTKYIARIEVRKIKEEEEDNQPRDLIAKKKGMILSIEASHGEVVKKVYDYVDVGDVIVSGTIHNKEEAKDYVRAQGKVFAETWYTVTVEVPYFYKEVKKTGREQKLLSFRFLNFEFRPFSKFSTSEDTILYKVENRLFPLSISYLSSQETEVDESLYTYDMALEKAHVEARTKLLSALGPEDEIIYEKGLKNYEEDSKIIVEIFFKVKEDITSYIEIQQEPIQE